MHFSFVLTILAALLAFVLWFFRRSFKHGTAIAVNPMRSQAILECADIGVGEELGLSKVAARAFPNQRLAQAFKIDNALTTDDDEYRKDFKHNVSKMMDLKTANWKRVGILARPCVSDRTRIIDQRTDLILLVQSLALKVTLYVFFKLDPLTIKDETSEQIASSINGLWIESKTTSMSCELNQQRLQAALLRVLPDVDPDPTKTPLNFILPAYTKLWRVVLFCFIEVTFRPGAQPNWRQELAHFLADPKNGTFEKASRGLLPTAVPVKYIINEALRLYPPTKRIYRRYNYHENKPAEMIAADIERCHQIPKVWGQSSQRFEPERWRNLGKEARDAYMPFGAGVFQCPAKTMYGPFMIGILVAALAAHISTENWELRLCRGGSRVSHALERTEVLASDENSYELVEIVRRRVP